MRATLREAKKNAQLDDVDIIYSLEICTFAPVSRGWGPWVIFVGTTYLAPGVARRQGTGVLSCRSGENKAAGMVPGLAASADQLRPHRAADQEGSARDFGKYGDKWMVNSFSMI